MMDDDDVISKHSHPKKQKQRNGVVRITDKRRFSTSQKLLFAFSSLCSARGEQRSKNADAFVSNLIKGGNLKRVIK